MGLGASVAAVPETAGIANALGTCSRISIAEEVRAVYSAQLGPWPQPQQLPMVYSDIYNIGFGGLERIHPFDSQKFGKVVHNLQAAGVLKASQLLRPHEVTDEMLLDVHTEAYLQAVRSSNAKLTEVTETWAIRLLPNWIVQWRLHRPMRYHVGGTMLALAVALQHGWSINLGGGMHHAHRDDGAGWCLYDDWVLALRMLRRASGGKVQRAMLIDLDVHQGNGHERDKLNFKDSDLYILDIYNVDQWPWDKVAKEAINWEGAMHNGMGDEAYLGMLRRGLDVAFGEFKPDIVLYNAGTDILAGDPLGLCQVSAEAVATRDEMVFGAAKSAGVPICMALSGGYARNSAGVISACLLHVIRKFELIRPAGKSSGDSSKP